ncbi:hypothetical protein GCM10027451_49070 [Geodermatophilus aquaeductus]|uniref:Anti-anti-sigma factor n=1 Tax=Geodermatophilus aquaeductus TaxID=1564161 RepID=A0A521FTH6_9ACTN|nr:anti-anti-sigma factor [Geodermatophilus aquaeductus]
MTVALDPAADGSLTVTVTDSGTWRPKPTDSGFRGRGRGLQMIGVLAADTDLRPGPAGTLLRFRMPPSPVAAPRPRLGNVAGSPGRPATLTASDANGRRCVELAGDLDLAGAAAVRDALLAELADHPRTTLDLTGLGFVASVGAGPLLEAAEVARTAGELDVLLPPAGPARRLLDLTGLTAALRTTPGSVPQ